MSTVGSMRRYGARPSQLVYGTVRIRHYPQNASIAQWLEQDAYIVKVTSSSLVRSTKCTLSSAGRASVLHTEGRKFDSYRVY